MSAEPTHEGPPAPDSELLNSAAEHLEARAKAVGDVSDDPAIFVARARIHDAGVWREAAQEVRGLAPSSGTPHSVETRINSAEPTDRAAILREAVERLRQVPFTNVLTELRRMADEGADEQPETQADGWHLTPQTLDLFVRALVNEVDYDIHKSYECGEEDGADHYPELVAEAAEMLDAITNQQHAS